MTEKIISPREIAFDIDGVFANTMGLFIRIIREEYGIDHVQYEHITRYYLEECLDIEPDIISDVIRRILDGGYDQYLQPIDGSCRILTALGAHTPLLFVTARPIGLFINKWVSRMLPDVESPIEVIATGAYEAKGDVLRERGIRFFVEDSLEACRLLSEQGITPLLFAQPWNRSAHVFCEVRSWADIAALIDFVGR